MLVIIGKKYNTCNATLLNGEQARFEALGITQTTGSTVGDKHEEV